MVYLFFAIAVGYLLGSIPWGYLLGKAIRGIDIRNFGSGNIGMANVQRILGSSSGLLVLGGDIGKGALSVYLGTLLASLAHMSPQVMGGDGGHYIHYWTQLACLSEIQGGKGSGHLSRCFPYSHPISPHALSYGDGSGSRIHSLYLPGINHSSRSPPFLHLDLDQGGIFLSNSECFSSLSYSHQAPIELGTLTAGNRKKIRRKSADRYS